MRHRFQSVKRSCALAAIFAVFCTCVLATACAESGDPYSGVWAPSDERFTFRIEKAGDGWLVWEEGPMPEKILSWEVDGELKVGTAVFRRSGDELVFVALPDAPPVHLTRCPAPTLSGSP